MQFVEPIRSNIDLDNMLNYFSKQNKRDEMLFFLGINTALRISDLLLLKVEDVRNKNGVRIREMKTNKFKEIPILPHVKKRINDYCLDKEDNDFLFRPLYRKVNKPLSRQSAWYIIKKGASECGIKNVGCHTLRKTFGYHYYQSTQDVVTLMKIYNHNDQKTTLRYIGIEQDQIADSIRKFGGFR